MRLVAVSMLVVAAWVGVGLAADDLPFVIGGDGSGGKVPAVAAPSCAAESVFGQQGYPNSVFLPGVPSDYGLGAQLVFENFSGVSEEICGIQWWGFFSYDDNPCVETNLDFAIGFLDTSETVVDDFVLTATMVDTGIVYSPNNYPLYEFRVTLPSCISLSEGYVSVVGGYASGGGDPACIFAWLASPDGDGEALSNLGPIQTDLAVCLLTSEPDDDDGGDDDDADDGDDDDNPPTPNGCCGGSGPVAPLGLAIGMLLMSRYGGYRRARRRC